MPCSGKALNAKLQLYKNVGNTTRMFQTKASARNVELAHCFLQLADMPNFALDRLSRYETNLWRQAGRILYALEMLDRRKPQERGYRFRFGDPSGQPSQNWRD
jgi:hypothetical protein